MHDDVAKRTDPARCECARARAIRGAKGDRPGQRSARKPQLAVAESKKEGGGHAGLTSPRNHLAKWTREEWGTRKSGETGEHELPRMARETLSASDCAHTTATKRADNRAGSQSRSQLADIARTTAAARKSATALSAPTRSAPDAPCNTAAAAGATFGKPALRRAHAHKRAVSRRAG